MPLIRRMLELRAEEAGHARLRQLRRGLAGAQDGRVAGQVLAFLRELAVKAKPFAERDMAELREFAVRRDSTSAGTLGHRPGSRRSCCRQRYAFSEQE
jgi:oligopeptidase A